MQKYSLQFEKPAVLEVLTHDNRYTKVFDVLKSYRMLQQAEKEPTPDAMWGMIENYLKTNLGLQSNEDLAEGMAYEFREAIIGIYVNLSETVKKKVAKDCLLASFFPGIPSDYPEWPDFLKDAWLGNILLATAERDWVERLITPTTPENIQRAVLVRTGDTKLAEQALRDSRMIVELAALKNKKFP